MPHTSPATSLKTFLLSQKLPTDIHHRLLIFFIPATTSLIKVVVRDRRGFIGIARLTTSPNNNVEILACYQTYGIRICHPAFTFLILFHKLSDDGEVARFLTRIENYGLKRGTKMLIKRRIKEQQLKREIM